MEAALQGLVSYQPICLISNEATHTGATQHERIKKAQARVWRHGEYKQGTDPD